MLQTMLLVAIGAFVGTPVVYVMARIVGLAWYRSKADYDRRFRKP